MRLEFETPGGVGWADLDRPRGARALLALTHGAGGGVETADLLAIRAASVEAGIAVALITQPYRVAGRRTPPASGPQDTAWLALVAVLRARRGLGALPFVVGGRSNGARVACRTAVASGAVGVVALAFPLHPPGRPEKSRLDELAGAGLSTLVVQGDRDPFGLPPKGKGRRIVVVPGADHALRRGTAIVATAVTSFVISTLSGGTPGVP
ncbi:MAG: alpha/beta hydrolase family protein [Jatrophihabitantaceae bacterium]